MKKYFSIPAILLILVFSVSAQEAQLIDSFGVTNCDDYRARIDNLIAEVSRISKSKAYVFVYEGDIEQRIEDKTGKYQGKKFVPSEIGLAKDIIGYFQMHVFFRDFPSERFEFIEAGFREKFTVELWLVPDKAETPKASPTLEKINQRKRKNSQFGFCGEM